MASWIDHGKWIAFLAVPALALFLTCRYQASLTTDWDRVGWLLVAGMVVKAYASMAAVSTVLFPAFRRVRKPFGLPALYATSAGIAGIAVWLWNAS